MLEGVEAFGARALDAAGPLLALVALAGATLVAVWVALRVAAALARRASLQHLTWTLEACGRALCLLVPVVALRIALPALAPPDRLEGVVDHVTRLLLIGGSGWLLTSLTLVFERDLHSRYLLDVADNLTARRIHTKFRLVRRTLVTSIGLVTFAGMLMTFPAARSIGAGLLASAGIAGIALGIAARPTIEAWIAGIQLAITEPIRLDDVVIVEGEWGRVEEITATYVGVCIWDLRRLVVPIRDFIDKPFQNWTRTTADLLGVVTVEVDYRTPVDAVREAVESIVRGSSRWNGDFWNLQVVEAGERTMRLRVLVSASDASQAWELRCEVREKLIAHLQEQHPEALPRLRIAAEAPSADEEPPS
jgi:small-conductance mechanosensitive channel